MDLCLEHNSVTTVDFKAMGQARCDANMYTAIAEIRVQDPPSAEYDKEFMLEGGVS